MSYYNQIRVGSFLFFFEQLSLLAAIYHDGAGWHFRFGGVKGFQNLNPIVATWKIAFLIFGITLVVMPGIGVLFSDRFTTYLDSIQYNNMISVSGFLGAFFFIWHYTTRKNWNKPQVIILTGSIILFIIPFGLTYAKLFH